MVDWPRRTSSLSLSKDSLTLTNWLLFPTSAKVTMFENHPKNSMWIFMAKIILPDSLFLTFFMHRRQCWVNFKTFDIKNNRSKKDKHCSLCSQWCKMRRFEWFSPTVIRGTYLDWLRRTCSGESTEWCLLNGNLLDSREEWGRESSEKRVDSILLE